MGSEELKMSPEEKHRLIEYKAKKRYEFRKKYNIAMQPHNEEEMRLQDWHEAELSVEREMIDPMLHENDNV